MCMNSIELFIHFQWGWALSTHRTLHWFLVLIENRLQEGYLRWKTVPDKVLLIIHNKISLHFSEQERISNYHKESERLRTSNTEFQQEIQSCREREAELLEFTQKLTEKNVRLQSEFTAVEARAHQLTIEHSSCEVCMQRALSKMTDCRQK